MYQWDPVPLFQSWIQMRSDSCKCGTAEVAWKRWKNPLESLMSRETPMMTYPTSFGYEKNTMSWSIKQWWWNFGPNLWPCFMATLMINHQIWRVLCYQILLCWLIRMQDLFNHISHITYGHIEQTSNWEWLVQPMFVQICNGLWCIPQNQPAPIKSELMASNHNKNKTGTVDHQNLGSTQKQGNNN